MFPIGHAVGGLADVGGLEVQGEVVAHLPAVDEGAGVVDAVLVAQGVKALLVDEGVDELPADRGGDAVGGEGILVLGGQLHIAVPAADDQHRLVGKLGGHVGHVFAEAGRVLIGGADPVVDDGRAVGGAGGELAKADRADAVGLVKGPGHAVDVDVPSKQQGLEAVFHVVALPLFFREREEPRGSSFCSRSWVYLCAPEVRPERVWLSLNLVQGKTNCSLGIRQRAQPLTRETW